jgi:hypothetical protein
MDKTFKVKSIKTGQVGPVGCPGGDHKTMPTKLVSVAVDGDITKI